MDDKVKKNIKKAVDGFLAENADLFGFAYVWEVVMPQDSREARIFVHFDCDAKEGKKMLDEKKRQISKAINDLIAMKYSPKIRLEGVDNETISV